MPVVWLLVAVAVSGHAQVCHAQAAVFAGCGFFDTPGEGAKTVAEHRDSGFDTVLLETHFDATGAIRSNRVTLVDGGAWVGPEKDKQNVLALVATIDRVEFWFAGWSRRDYDDLRKVKASPEATANLKQNLALVKRLGVCGYCDDDEDVYDLPLALWMGRVVQESGLKYSIAPYKRPKHWVPIVNEVGVDRIYYQSYFPRRKLDGWDQLEGQLWAGLNTDDDTVEVVREKFAAFGKNPKVVGGFLWSSGIIRGKRGGDFRGYADAIEAGVAANVARLAAEAGEGAGQPSACGAAATE
ncbi:MAG: hypothetical protein AAF790_03595 [Planctomycetota bacterium]